MPPCPFPYQGWAKAPTRAPDAHVEHVHAATQGAHDQTAAVATPGQCGHRVEIGDLQSWNMKLIRNDLMKSWFILGFGGLYIYIYISIMEDIIVLVVDASSITFLNKKSTNLGVSWLAWIGLWGFPGTDLYGGYSWVTPEMIKQNIEKSLHIEGLVGFSNRTFRWPTEISFVGSQAKKQSHWEPKMHSWLVFHGGKTKTSVVGRWCWSWKRVCGMCHINFWDAIFKCYCW